MEITRAELLDLASKHKSPLEPEEVILTIKYHFGLDLPSNFGSQFVEASISTALLGYLGSVVGSQISVTIERLNVYERTVDVKL